jgi:uncharacterized protein
MARVDSNRGRTRVRRHPERGRYDRATIDAVLESALIAHVAFVDEGQPFCVPMLHARIDDRVVIHGSTASRTVRTLGRGAPACVTVTAIDGLVLARSIYHHSANYRSAMLLGSFEVVSDPAAKLAALEAFADKILPGRWNEVRRPNRQELKAVTVLAMPIDEASAKVRTGPPSDGASPDAENGAWAGVVPLATGFGPPEPAPELSNAIPMPKSVQALLDREGERP